MVDEKRPSSSALETRIYHLDRNELNAECQRWALVHGFVQRYFPSDNDQDSNITPYPFTIYPSPYPRNEYERACRLQFGMNRLVHRLAFDLDLMDSVFHNLIDCDPFIKRLRNIYDHLEQLPFKNTAETCIIRTDYMLQQLSTSTKRTKLRLVEINTIAVGLGAAAKLIHAWHKQCLSRIEPEVLSQLAENESYDLIIDTLYKSWEIYNKSCAIILFVVPEREFNIGDQMLIEQGLLSHGQSSPLVKHVTFIEICHNCHLDSNGILYFDRFEVGLVYYRSGYDPKHFSSEEIWQAYIMLESSRAVKCPSLRYHLAGMKCFQLAILEETFLERIFQGEEQYINDFRDVVEEMFTIDQVMNDPVLQKRIRDKPETFYLKQSREGGGNVYCGSQLKDRIDQIIVNQQSNRYFLMSRIYPPVHSSLVRSSRPNPDNELIRKEQINGELGIFGSLISTNGIVISERIGGSLLRSKPAGNIEGGVASGQGFIDSVLLV